MAAEDEASKVWDQIVQFAETEPQTFWILVGILVVLLYLFLKPKKEGESPIGLNPFEFEVFKRR